MQICFVFDSTALLVNATAEEFARLHLTPEEAVELAMANIKRVYGEPRTEAWVGGLTLVLGKLPGLESSYFIDRAFWRTLLAQNQEGLVTAVPKRGGLVFATGHRPASDVWSRLGRGFLYVS